MYGRPYSGNIRDFNDAVDSIRTLEFEVSCDSYHSASRRELGVTIYVKTSKDGLVACESFSSRDEDILLIQSANWLRRLYDHLKDWK